VHPGRLGRHAVSLASVFAPDFWASPTHWDIALLAVVAIVVAVAINLASIKAASLVNNAAASNELFGTILATIALPASSHVVLYYALGFELAGAAWYFGAVRNRLRRGEAGPGTAR